MIGDIHIALKVVSYTGWAATTALGFLGSWVWNFTQDNPDNPTEKMLTPQGRWAIAVFLFSLVCSIASSVLSEINAAKQAEVAKAEKQNLLGQLTLLRGQNHDLSARLTQVLRKHGIWDLAAADRGLHDKLQHLRQGIRGRAEERERLTKLSGQAIPFDALAIFASFNLSGQSLRRNRYWTEELAGIIAFMEADVVFLQEIPDQQVLRSFRKLLPEYDIRWLSLSSLPLHMGLALLYRRATVELVDEPDIVGDDNQFARVPISQKIKIDDVEMRVVNLHLFYGDGRPGNQRRRDELQSLLRLVEKHYPGEKLVLGGVFQWDAKNPEMNELRKRGFLLTSEDLPDDADETPMTSRPHRYSQFALNAGLAPFYIRGSARYEDLRLLYPDFKREDWRRFVDHSPLLIALRLDAADR